MGLLYVTIPPIVEWTFLNASFVGEDRQVCKSGGACWVFISQHLNEIFYGFYDLEQQWRVNVTGGILFLLIAGLLVPQVPYKRWIGFTLLGVFPFVATALLRGDVLGLSPIETTKWGGLFLTLVIAFVGIAGSFPLGILLALGRRSSKPVIRLFSITFIEIWRGVPLVTVLFMSSVMLPLFFEDGLRFDKLFRALIGVTLFASAYMAEVIRGGLQALPKGQYEAAETLGLNYWQSHLYIILPQALRIVIPGIMNTFIGLFKDTTLVLIIGLFDVLGIIQAANKNPEWLGFTLEGYCFASLIFWVFCYSMSKYSQSVEQKIAKGQS